MSTTPTTTTTTAEQETSPSWEEGAALQSLHLTVWIIVNPINNTNTVGTLLHYYPQKSDLWVRGKDLL